MSCADNLCLIIRFALIFNVNDSNIFNDKSYILISRILIINLYDNLYGLNYYRIEIKLYSMFVWKYLIITFKLYEKKIWKIMWQRLIDIRFNIQFNIANNKK